MTYWDSSALIKKYLKEDGSHNVQQRLSEDPFLVTSQLTYAEIHATFARKQRENDISLNDYQKICKFFETDWKAIFIVRLDDALLPEIRNLVGKHPLRGADSVHLASAIYVSGQTKQRRLPFACADNRLLHAAVAEGLKGWNPLEP